MDPKKARDVIEDRSLKWDYVGHDREYEEALEEAIAALDEKIAREDGKCAQEAWILEKKGGDAK